MNEQAEVRSRVAEFYGKAVSRGGGCCGTPARQSAVAGLAGYGEADTGALPAEAAAHSFGCGNPLAFSEVRPGDVVLDLGSGAGLDLLIAARKVGPEGRVIGVDMTDEMIAKARANAAAAGCDTIEVRKGIIEDLPVESASVDWVISNCVINLSPQKPRVFAEIARVLKPGGRMLVSDIVVEDLPAWVRDSQALYLACVAGAISEGAYLAGLGAAGLVDMEVRGRLVYDAAQLAAIVGDERPGAPGAPGAEVGAACCGAPGAPDADKARAAAAAVEGKVWSAKIYARKPEA